MPEQIPNDIALRVLLVFLGLLALGFAVALASLSRSYERARQAMLDAEREWAQVTSSLDTALRDIDGCTSSPRLRRAYAGLAVRSMAAAQDAAIRARQNSLRARGALRDEVR